MEQALYAPVYGYYTGGAHKIGAAGDFITAPELSPPFGQALARQIKDLLPQTGGEVYEFGAGTGALAATPAARTGGSRIATLALLKSRPNWPNASVSGYGKAPPNWPTK